MPRFREKKKAPPQADAVCKQKGRYVRLSSYFTTSTGHNIPQSLDMLVDVCPELSDADVQKRLNRISVVQEYNFKKKAI